MLTLDFDFFKRVVKKSNHMEADSHTFFLLNCAKFISDKDILNKDR